ncbi:tetratricopeptide repeat protein [Flavobacterium chryseum]|uniref:tetratricopeptide repeat protein n=1 Tax=Flavobacterium sp. P3160 TaxID=2512113 RepID=UPI0010F2CE51|nr:tetratricopeptide repeat protein [Flavobacterium sp. P3160]TDO77547.1 tetratricopeptide repeat protein [Flavobacterium sp. P3160]
MKYLLILISFFNSILYSQTKQNIDSISYYNKLANKNLKIRKYDQAIFYTKKSIDFCVINNKVENLANQTFKLGKIYYNQRNYEEALKKFHQSVSLFKNVKPSCTKVLAFHYIGVTNTAKGNYTAAEIYYKKAENLLKKLNIADNAETLSYQKAMAFKNNKNYNAATKPSIQLYRNRIMRQL